MQGGARLRRVAPILRWRFLLDDSRPTGRALRLALVAHSHVIGGIERHVLALAHGLRGRGHQVFYAGPLDGWLGEQMRAHGYSCRHLPMRGMYDFWSVLRLRALCLREQIELVHGHAQRGARYAAWAARRSRIGSVATAHSTNAAKWFDRDAQLIAVSGAVRDWLLSRDIEASRVSVVRSGVDDIGATMPESVGPGMAPRPLVLGMLSRLERVKGHDLALDALAAIGSRVDCRLVIVGPDDTEWARWLRRRVRQLTLDDRVEFQGSREDLGQAFAQFDIVLAPSRREALSLTLVEAAAAARPAIACRVGGIPEVVVDGETGVLIPTENPGALAEAIVRLASDRALRLRMGEAARIRFEREFTIDAMLDGVERVYRRSLRELEGVSR